jgi:hypothetical protein
MRSALAWRLGEGARAQLRRVESRVRVRAVAARRVAPAAAGEAAVFLAATAGDALRFFSVVTATTLTGAGRTSSLSSGFGGPA